METLWADSPATLIDLHRVFPAKPYRTLVGTLNRMYRKGLLRRERVTRANAYSPAMTRQELATAIVGSILRSGSGSWPCAPAMASPRAPGRVPE